MESWRQAAAANCDTLFLSSEEFSGPRALRPLRSALRRFRRATRAEIRPLFVRRELSELAFSNLMQHITGEAGFYLTQRYDLRGWACRFARAQPRLERFFSSLGGQTIPLADVPRDRLAAELLFAGTGRRFPDVVTPVENVGADKFGESPIMLMSYPLRVMSKVANGGSIVSPACAEPAFRAIRSLQLDEEAFGSLLAGFQRTVREQITLGIADAMHDGDAFRGIRDWLAGLRHRRR